MEEVVVLEVTNQVLNIMTLNPFFSLLECEN